MGIKERKAIENSIISCAVQYLLVQGFSLTVENIGKEPLAIKQSTDHDAIMACIRKTVEDTIYVSNDKSIIGTLSLVYGGDGWTVIGKFSESIKHLILPAEIMANEYQAAYTARQ